MLTDAALRAQALALWDKLWSGGLSNPFDAIEHDLHAVSGYTYGTVVLVLKRETIVTAH